MEWKFIIALVIAIPAVLFPVALVWFLNIGGIISAIKEIRARREARAKASGASDETRIVV